MNKETKKMLSLNATKIRMGIIEGTHSAKAGHPGGSLSSADLFAYLYFAEMKNIDPKNPKAENRDRFVLSKGHCAPGLYSALALKGFFPFEDLKTLRHIDSYLQGHPNMNTVAGVDMSTGSLLGDGEIEEGQVWEAMMFASQYKLDNLCVIVDVNGLQIDGKCEDVMNAEPIDKKMEAFGLNVIKINGNDFDELEKAFNAFHENIGSGKPFGIIMKTVKGLGVSYMENQVDWHGKAPNDAEYEIAMNELKAKLAEIEEA